MLPFLRRQVHGKDAREGKVDLHRSAACQIFGLHHDVGGFIGTMGIIGFRV